VIVGLPRSAHVAVLAIAITLRVDASAIDSRSTPSHQFALVGGTIFVSPDDDPIPDGAILIRDGVIVAVGPRTSLSFPREIDTLDCSGLTITAGFWNSHVHFMERKWADVSTIPASELARELQSMLTQHGFTSVFDTGSAWENTRRLRDRIHAGEVAGPRIRSTGEFLVPKGGSARDLVFDLRGSMRMQTPELVTGADAAAASKRLLEAGADGIKLYISTAFPPVLALSEAAIRAAVHEAHNRRKPVFAHPSTREGLLAAARAGVDVVVHTSWQTGTWEAEVVTAMKTARMAVIPTLKLWNYELRHDRTLYRDRIAAAAIEQLRRWTRAGGTVLFGTDVGYMSDHDPTEEYVLMAKAGMSARQILASLTTTPSQQFGESQRLGRVAPGLVADLVVLGSDPTRDVRAFAAVRYTVVSGRVIYRQTPDQTAQ
jgi:imidazolonepropionase-like amidohydrolase